MRSATLKLSVESVPSRINTIELRHPTRTNQHHSQHKLSEHTLRAYCLLMNALRSANSRARAGRPVNICPRSSYDVIVI
jgi:hypothetical protein